MTLRVLFLSVVESTRNFSCCFVICLPGILSFPHQWVERLTFPLTGGKAEFLGERIYTSKFISERQSKYGEVARIARLHHNDKLHIPRSRSPLVVRTRLFDKLSEGLDKRLTLIHAPAGYGKTTLLSEWSARLEVPVAWVSLDQGDQDRIRFWAHTVAAFAQVNPGFNRRRLASFLTDTSRDSIIAASARGFHDWRGRNMLGARVS